jgi:hypothetical protein
MNEEGLRDYNNLVASENRKAQCLHYHFWEICKVFPGFPSKRQGHQNRFAFFAQMPKCCDRVFDYILQIAAIYQLLSSELEIYDWRSYSTPSLVFRS